MAKDSKGCHDLRFGVILMEKRIFHPVITVVCPSGLLFCYPANLCQIPQGNRETNSKRTHKYILVDADHCHLHPVIDNTCCCVEGTCVLKITKRIEPFIPVALTLVKCHKMNTQPETVDNNACCACE